MHKCVMMAIIDVDIRHRMDPNVLFCDIAIHCQDQTFFVNQLLFKKCVDCRYPWKICLNLQLQPWSYPCFFHFDLYFQGQFFFWWFTIFSLIS